MRKKTGSADVQVKKRASDFEMRAARAEEDRRLAAWRHELLMDEAPLITALRHVGILVSSVWDLVNTAEPYPKAIPVLLEHLHRPYHPRNREGIVRALTVKEAREVAYESVLKEYEKQPADEDRLPPQERGLKAAMASAVSFLAGRTRKNDLLRLVRDRRHGPSRAFFAEDLGRIGDENVVPVLEELCDDPEIAESAQGALKKLRRRLQPRL
jgi:hypothetical protein